MDTTQVNTLKQAASAVTGEPFTFDITIIPQTKLQAWMMKKGWLPVKKSFEIKPVVFGTLMKISGLMLTIDPDFIKHGKGLLDTSWHLANGHAETLVKILALAIQNNRHEPDPWLMNTLRNNLTPREMMALLSMVLEKMDLTNFISTIISIRGLNVLSVSEKSKPESEVSPSIQGS